MAKFLIATGGTGMRCMEAFIHICAIGMLDNETINILLIDTDHQNGNKSRTRTLATTYRDIKMNGELEGKPLEDSFFSAKLNIFEFYPEYKSPSNTFDKIRNQSKDNNKDDVDNQDLADLLFEKETQAFDLEHGYRAQTHVGSYLMYYAIIEEVSRVKKGTKADNQKNGLSDFIKLLTADSEAQVFIFGSIFGGTGASSIPIIPRAIQKASELQGKRADKVIFGATLLTDYFTFTPPTDNELQRQKVIATANRFRLNSQAALMFYDKDTTMSSVYQRLYLVGWPMEQINLSKNSGENKVITGGGAQRNPAHAVELVCAFAAFDFFKNVKKFDRDTHEWKFKSVESNFDNKELRFKFEDFIGDEDHELFKKKMAAFYGMCLLLSNEYPKIDEALIDFVKNIKRRAPEKSEKYIKGEVHPLDSKKLADYIKLFSFSYNHEHSKIIDGWLHQLRESSTSKQFLFENDVFSRTYADLVKVNWGSMLTEEERKFATKTWKHKTFGGNPSFDMFEEQFVKEDAVLPDTSKISFPLELLLNWIYNTFNHLHQFK